MKREFPRDWKKKQPLLAVAAKLKFVPKLVSIVSTMGARPMTGAGGCLIGGMDFIERVVVAFGATPNRCGFCIQIVLEQAKKADYSPPF